MTLTVNARSTALDNLVVFTKALPRRVEELTNWATTYTANASAITKFNVTGLVLADLEASEEYFGEAKDFTMLLASITARCTEGRA